MDLAARCKERLQYFRIKELKYVLTELGLSKQGKKQDLVDRILALLSDEQVSKVSAKKYIRSKEDVAKLVDDAYRKMQTCGAIDLASKGNDGKINDESEDSFHLDIKVQCLCGSSLRTESTIKCEDASCHVWQHIGCVIIPEKPENPPQVPELFYCEICRLRRADPFWASIAHPLYPVKLDNIPTDGINPVQGVEKTFHLTRADKDLLAKQEYEVQAWCMLLNDKVPYRMQWPQYADLQVNGVPVRCINRPGSQLLGANGRDDGSLITACTKDGINKISLTASDARTFCLGVRIVKRQTLQQILNLIPKESVGEPFEDALARVRRCIGGGATTDDADSDSDLEVVADSFGVNLRCPNSGSRMKIAGRFKPCVHMGCFDLEVFVELNQRSRKWQCPICLKNYSLEYLIVDPYFNRITSKMHHCSEDFAEIEVKPDGSWRVKTKTDSERREVGELSQWHNPDSTLDASSAGEMKPKVELMKQIKQESALEGHTGTGLKLGIRKNRSGVWEVSRPEEMNTSFSGNRLPESCENYKQKFIPMSSSAAASGRDEEDPSVNHTGCVNFEYTNNGIEVNSFSLNLDSNGYGDRNIPAPVDEGDAEVIVLSDSDVENDTLVPPTNLYKNNQTIDGGNAFQVPPPGLADAYSQDPTLASGANSCLGIYSSNENEFGVPQWHLPPPGSQTTSAFQLFNSDGLGDLADMEHGPGNCTLPMNDGYALASDTVMGSACLASNSFVGRSVADINDGLVDNPLAFHGEDPSLLLFPPTRPSNGSASSILGDQSSNGVPNKDWISLRLGGSAIGNNGECIPVNGLNSPYRETAMDSLADTASILIGMNDSKSDKRSREGSDSPFSFPRQKRSVRQRLPLSIDLDSE